MEKHAASPAEQHVSKESVSISKILEHTRSDKKERTAELRYPQVCRLHLLMYSNLNIKPRSIASHFPSIEIEMHSLVTMICDKLSEAEVRVRDIRLNGGAASYVLSKDEKPSYNDIDLIFGISPSGEDWSMRVKKAVVESLLEFFPNDEGQTVGEKPSLGTIEEVYVHKMVKVSNDLDQWSLISFSNNNGIDVELKFVDRMRRQFEFSVDSFQIILDNLFTFYRSDSREMHKTYYPRIIAESVYGDYNAALKHLNEKLIATDHPEQIRGGGLLKYCHLIARGYQPAAGLDNRTTEKYMCSRFFIDFSGVNRQAAKIEAYIAAHFVTSRQTTDDNTKFVFLSTLLTVVEESTVCLLGPERYETLALLTELVQRAYIELCSTTVTRGVARCVSPKYFSAQTWRSSVPTKRRTDNSSQMYYQRFYVHNNGQYIQQIVQQPYYSYYLPIRNLYHPQLVNRNEYYGQPHLGNHNEYYGQPQLVNRNMHNG